MRPSLPLAALLGAALSFLPGCESTKSSGPSPSDTRAQDTASVQAAEAWARARVGDRVTYWFSASKSPRPQGAMYTVVGYLTLEVVAVQQPWVWVHATFSDYARRPGGPLRLKQDLIIPVRADTTRSLDVPKGGKATAEVFIEAGRKWEATRYVSDERPVDGPLRTRVYANTPGPLYLTRGLLEATMEPARFAELSGFQMTLREVHEGSADSGGAVPSMERPLGPGAYYERAVDVGPAPGVQRMCITAERGYVLRTEGPANANTVPCSDFSQAEPEPLEELLMALPWDAVFTEGSVSEWPPDTNGNLTAGTFTAQGRDLPSLTEESHENVEGTERVFSQTYAADPWAPGLAGLPYEARFQPLASSTERVVPGGKNAPEGGTRLVRWGSWITGAK